MTAPLLFHPCADAVYGFPGARLLACADSPWQHIEVWDTPQLGCLFALDARPMTSAGDEFIYHECMTHVAALSHPAPRAALVLGGGDGGAARQLLRHPGIERIVVAELDADVVRLTADYLPEVRGGAFDDPRVELVIGDAADFVAKASADHHALPFDLVVFDLTPPDSPAAGLYAPPFYAALKRIMSEDALVSLHLGSPLYHTARVGALLDGLRTAFAIVRPLGAWVPLYGSFWLMAVASDHIDPVAQSEAMLTARIQERELEGLRFYDARLHATLLAAPQMFRDKLGQFLQL
ncbi:spermidine synthase [Paraburkholderia bannensis]|uniref:Polyamine aminopropyltransferase n=1 Tax=Paraburkholderia bannensis TaxID=765414 RepID=A0A7W9TWP9_9BURK|nr:MULTISPECIES: polyamine aminopropyltransferase [Paraburkholderia]MBB3257799.1 spermidine synthase [Paraburkholderia sp. WP4_3_2]MBB6102812.1 spermidine synthase [Paraburkholderia bannensis]